MEQFRPTYTDAYDYEPSSTGSQLTTMQVPKEFAMVLKQCAEVETKKELEECKSKLTDAQNYIRKLEAASSKTMVTCYEQQERIEQLEKEKREREAIQGNNEEFFPIYDPRMFKGKNDKHPSPQWLKKLWDIIYYYSITACQYGDICIENGTSAIVIFKIIKECNRIPYKFTGSYDDFTVAWNANIASRNPDQSRRKSLTCQTGSIKTEYYKTWKDISIGKLEQSSQQDSKHPQIYSKAHIIITVILPDIISIPSIYE